MSDVAIRVDGLSKRFSIHAKQESYQTLRDTVANAALRPLRALKSRASHNGVNGADHDGLFASSTNSPITGLRVLLFS